MVRIDIEDIRRIEDEMDNLNKLDLAKVELYIADERVSISEKQIKDWKFTGLNNYYFFKDEFYLDEPSKKFRLSICPAFEKDSSAVKEFSFDTKAEMLAASNCAADLLLFLQDDLQAMEDFTNSFDCQEYIDGDWEIVE